MNADTIRETALSYAARGWHVFPLHTPDGTGQCSCALAGCRNAGKHPRTGRGLHDATSDRLAIEQWWGWWPEANIGIATGRGAGAFVVDIDPASGGYDAADALQRQHGAFSATLAARTGSDGLHLYYRWPSRGIVRNSAGKLGPGIDVRGAGGYVVAPPSLHRSGNRYAWTGLDDAQDIAAAPAWLLSLLLEQPANKTSPRTAAERKPSAEKGTIPEGLRNTTLASKGGLMRRFGFSEAEILAALTVMNKDRCRPPLADEEVVEIAHSVSRYAPEPQPAATVIRLASGATLRPVARG